MARSHNIYVAQLSNTTIGTWTVKHECRTSLHKRFHGKCPSNLSVLRFRDNSDEPPVTVTLALFDFPKRDT